MRTELSDGTITIRAYEPGIELAVFEAARESVREVGPWMRTWRDGATYAQATQHVAESLHAWHTGQTGQGIATAAVRLIARFGFEDLGLQRLELLVAADNLASRRVAEKVGARFEGVLPAGPHGQGELEHTSYCFSLDR